MAPIYELAKLHGGPLDGDVVQAPMRSDHPVPERVIGLPVPVLDERTETMWWDTANYFFSPGANVDHRPGRLWHFSFSRLLPGYPTQTEEV